MMKKIELLAPAKNPDIARIAIDYGADAVYIGAEKFGARSGATNSILEIEKLTQYAHKFGAKIYLTINTLIYDDELDEVRKTIIAAYQAGVDAIIVQDMAILELDLPPIELHASTQTFALTPDRVKFLGSVGFSRVILERSATLEEIKAIRKVTDAELEVFVHGAICVGYSGQCYLSQTLMNTSGNRGQCAQPCRWTYNLLDENYKRILSDTHLLSVRDLDLSDHVGELIDAGVVSLKIEGRLKEADYIKNSVSYYRRAIDRYISTHDGYRAAADGNVVSDFTPDPTRTFSRGFSQYYFSGRQRGAGSLNTAKSVGKEIGSVTSVEQDYFVISAGNSNLRSADGICFMASDGTLKGTKINKVDGRRVFPNSLDGIVRNTVIYRNYDHEFTLSLDKSKTHRTIDCTMNVECSQNEIRVTATDIYGFCATASEADTFEPARSSEAAQNSMKTQLSKTGDTIFSITDINITVADVMPFVAISVINKLRRSVLEKLTQTRITGHKRQKRIYPTTKVNYPTTSVDYRANIVNSLAEKFYKEHGVNELNQGGELQKDMTGKIVMTTRYCLRREMGECLINDQPKYRKTLYIENNFHTFELYFDCKKCEMSLIYQGKRDEQNSNPGILM